ncbi:hypothetical protein AOR_1_2104174 [Paecilomyces variotii No. 5]|uniref:Uncharacterized protein n=1 Tax=Byssochlamys spectabilis (strain No. 5 / NBRC 109023) TaxID=1356009 RepID=V5G0B7_BYSSN|nr:hypothetical protein AOR_1_2104174 [Paecilomyces variotii No. 5]
MDSPSFQSPASPKGALYPVSPERINQQKPMTSPSRSTELFRSSRKDSTASDVQAKVAFINGLSRNGSPVPASTTLSSSNSSAALQRAIIGREEAESALANVSSQLSEAQSRERRLSERLESLMEELHNAKERQAHERTVFEKEVRRARKEAFKAGSTLVKLQEEIKNSRTEMKSLRDELKAEKDAKDKAKQEAFERAYALAGLTEELEVLKGKLRSLETDRATDSHSDALEAQAKEMEEDSAAMSAAAQEHSSSLTPTPRRAKRSVDECDKTQISSSVAEAEQHHIETPPKKPRLSHGKSTAEDEEIEATESEDNMLQRLNFELSWERRLRLHAEEMVHFLKMECQFKQCSCRIAESQGHEYVYDVKWYNMCKIREKREEAEAETDAEIKKRAQGVIPSHTPAGSPARASTPVREVNAKGGSGAQADSDEPTITFSPTTGTFRAIPSPMQKSPQRIEERSSSAQSVHSAPQAHPPLRHVAPSPLVPEGERGPRRSPNALRLDPPSKVKPAAPSTAPIELPPSLYENLFDRRKQESTPQPEVEQKERVKENVTVTKVPLHRENHTPVPVHDVSTIAGTPINREEALAQIRARRGRARSMPKRCASALEGSVRSGGMGTTPVRGSKRIPGVNNTDARSESDLSERRDLSAPMGKY